MTVHFNKQRIFDYFGGKATAVEMKQIEEWSRDPVNEELFYEWLDEWERAHLQLNNDQVQGLEKYRSFLYGEQRVQETIPGGIRLFFFGAAEFLSRSNVWIASVAVAILLTTLLWLPYEQVLIRTYTTDYGEIRTLILPDGSSATLNANSWLKVPRFGFGRRTRMVTLHGEALFNVIHTRNDQQFIVKTENAADVVVLGTEFSVFARDRGTRVKLNRGKVQVHYQGSERARVLTMNPGDFVMLNARGQVVSKNAEEKQTATVWVGQQFRFDKTSLSEIIEMLSENYDLTVALADPELAKLSLSGTYEAHRGEELLRSIAEVLELDVLLKKDKYILVSKNN